MRSRRAWALTAVIIGAAIGNLEAQSPPALFPITVDDKHGMIDRAGTVVIPPEYAEPVIFRDGLARVAKGNKVAYLDATGRFVIAPQNAAREPFAEGLTPALGRDPAGKVAWGYIDRTGGFVIGPRFADAKPFSEGLAQVGLPDQWGEMKYGYADKTGRLVVPARYAKTFPFSAGLARVAWSSPPRSIRPGSSARVSPWCGWAARSATSTGKGRSSSHRGGRWPTISRTVGRP